jgi:hypothetical protein
MSRNQRRTTFQLPPSPPPKPQDRHSPAPQRPSEPVIDFPFASTTSAQPYIQSHCFLVRGSDAPLKFTRDHGGLCLLAGVFSVRTSSLVHGRSVKVFFAISVPHAPTLSTNQPVIVIHYPPTQSPPTNIRHSLRRTPARLCGPNTRESPAVPLTRGAFFRRRRMAAR